MLQWGRAEPRAEGGSERPDGYPSTQPVRVRPIRIGMGWGWCAPHAHRQRGKTRGVETSYLRLKTCASLDWCFGTSHPRGRAPSAPRPGSAGRGRGRWLLRDGKGHPGLSFLLIDVDRTGSAQSCPALRSGKHKYGFHGGRGPSAFALAIGPLAPVLADPHRNKE